MLGERVSESIVSPAIERIKSITWKNAYVGVATHSNADPDALASVVLASHMAKHLGAKVCVMLPDGLSKVSRRILNNLELSLDEDCVDYSNLDICVVVDSSNPAQLGSYAEKCLGANKILLIDHHAPGELAKRACVSLISENSPSTTELVLDVVLKLGVPIDGRLAELAMAGIVYDSRRFTLASPRTFELASFLLRAGCNYERILEVLRSEKEWTEDLSERMAILKSLSRMRLGKACRDLMVVATHIGSHESLVSKILIDIGADVALVLVNKEDIRRISIRVSRRAQMRGIDASTLASYIASRMGGEGGGHREVAMVHLPSSIEPEALVDDIIKTIPGKIGRICAEVDRGGEEG